MTLSVDTKVFKWMTFVLEDSTRWEFNMVASKLSIQINELADKIEKLIREDELRVDRVKKKGVILFRGYDPNIVTNLASAVYNMLLLEVTPKGIRAQDPEELDDGKKRVGAVARNIEESLYALGFGYVQKARMYIPQ